MAKTLATKHVVRSGFTLVELLVVIAIIGTLTAIAVPALFGAMASARNAKTKAEIDMLHMALMNYKNEYGSFPPANMAGLWNGSAVNLSHPAYKHLTRIFPRLDEPRTGVNSPYFIMSRMSPAQALVFWMQGFYENPTNPITNGNPNYPGSDVSGSSAGNRKKMFDFDESRLYAAKMPYVQSLSTGQSFFPRNSPTASTEELACPVYFTGHPSCGLPYVYFDSRSYDDGPTQDITYTATSTIAGEPSTASPYINSTPPVNGTWGQQHMAGDTFQLIAAGKDGIFDGTTFNPAAFPASNDYILPWGNPPTSYTYTSPKDIGVGRGHADNITNFADRPLADAINALQSQ